MNEQQKQEITEFIAQYKQNKQYQQEIKKQYETKPLTLSILQIYALEEILKEGNKAIYQSFLQVKGNHEEAKAITDFQLFIKIYREDPYFKNQKLEQFLYTPESLSKMEIRIIEQLLEEKDIPKPEEEVLEYDDLNPICCESETEIRETLLNLLFGQAIAKLFELPELKEIKDRQKEDGRIANQDKPKVIQMLQQEVLMSPNRYNYIMESAERIIEKYKKDLDKLSSSFEKEGALESLQKYNTNLSIQEILGLPRPTTRKRQ